MLAPYIKAVPRALRAAIYKTAIDVLFPDLMSCEEAKRILDLDSHFTKLDLDSKFQRFYTANSTQNGGSPYIQQKIKNAFNMLNNHQSLSSL